MACVTGSCSTKDHSLFQEKHHLNPQGSRKREQGIERGREKPKTGESLFPSLGDGDDEALVLLWVLGLVFDVVCM